MDKGKKDSFNVRIISSAFTALALCVFKPFGLEAWHWQAYTHLLMFFVLGVCVCMLTDAIMKYIVKMPRSSEQGVSYVIRRNLWFQLINTPLISLMICLYRHFVLSDRVEANRFSLTNYLETLVIISFCSFAIGLYWRFKFRNRFLAAELLETQQLNEQLKKSSEQPMHAMKAKAEKPSDIPTLQEESREVTTITLTGTTSDTLTLEVSNLLYIEAVGNYAKVYHLHDGTVRTDMLRVTLKQVEDELRPFPSIVRSHRAFLVNLRQVEKIVSNAGSMQLLICHHHDLIPVSRSNMAKIKEAIRQL